MLFRSDAATVVVFTDAEGSIRSIASIENGIATITPNFSDQVAAAVQEHISEMPQVERDSSAPTIDDFDEDLDVEADLEVDEEPDYEY